MCILVERYSRIILFACCVLSGMLNNRAVKALEVYRGNLGSVLYDGKEISCVSFSRVDICIESGIGGLAENIKQKDNLHVLGGARASFRSTSIDGVFWGVEGSVFTPLLDMRPIASPDGNSSEDDEIGAPLPFMAVNKVVDCVGYGISMGRNVLADIGEYLSVGKGEVRDTFVDQIRFGGTSLRCMLGRGACLTDISKQMICMFVAEMDSFWLMHTMCVSRMPIAIVEENFGPYIGEKTVYSVLGSYPHDISSNFEEAAIDIANKEIDKDVLVKDAKVEKDAAEGNNSFNAILTDVNVLANYGGKRYKVGVGVDWINCCGRGFVMEGICCAGLIFSANSSVHMIAKAQDFQYSDSILTQMREAAMKNVSSNNIQPQFVSNVDGSEMVVQAASSEEEADNESADSVLKYTAPELADEPTNAGEFLDVASLPSDDTSRGIIGTTAPVIEDSAPSADEKASFPTRPKRNVAVFESAGIVVASPWASCSLKFNYVTSYGWNFGIAVSGNYTGFVAAFNAINDVSPKEWISSTEPTKFWTCFADNFIVKNHLLDLKINLFSVNFAVCIGYSF